LTYLSLQELCKNYRNIYEVTDWDELTAMFLADPIDSETLDSLIEELNQNGEFREPILLGTSEDDETGEEIPYVFDGAHRICAYLLAKREQAFIEEETIEAIALEKEPFEEYEILITLETKITGYKGFELEIVDNPETNGIELHQDIDQEEENTIWDTIRSLRVDNHTWITSSAIISSYDMESYESEMRVTWDTVPSIDPELINTAIKEKLKRYDVNIEELKIETDLFVDNYSDIFDEEDIDGDDDDEENF
jgi:hypothetical protein